MKYYILSFNNREYVLDISFFIDLLIDSLDNDLSLVMATLGIRTEEIEQNINLDSNKTYILHNDQIIEFNLNFDVVGYVKRKFMNEFYLMDYRNVLNQFKAATYINLISYLRSKYENFNVDRESVYLEILNSGDIEEISLLEQFIEILLFANEPLLYDSTDERNIVNLYDNLNELVISLIIYFNLHRYNYNSLNISKS